MATFVVVHGAWSGAHAWRCGVAFLPPRASHVAHVTAPWALTAALVELAVD